MTRILIAALAYCLCVFSSASQPLALDRIFHKPYIAGSRPQVAALSPDGRTLLLQWDSSATNTHRLWMTGTNGAGLRQVLDSAVASVAYAPDGKRLAFTQKGDVFLSDPDFKTVTRLTRTPASEGQPRWSPDSRWLAVATNNIYVFSATTPGVYQITNNTKDDISYSVIGFLPDNKRVLFCEFDRDGLPEFIIPDYLAKDVSTRSFKAGFSKMRIGIAPVDTGKTLWLKTPSDRFIIGSIQIAPNGSEVLLDHYDTLRKNRRFHLFDTDSGAARLVYTEYDSTWIEGGSHSARWANDSRSIFFTSERDGWNHLYRMTKDSSGLRQLTRGNWEVKWFGEHHDGKALYLVANKDDRTQWQVYALDAQGRIRRHSAQTGSYGAPVLSEKEDVLVCSYSDFDKPAELYAFAGGKERRLTHSIGKEFAGRQWIRPEIVRFPSRDGTMIPAMLYKPAALDTAKKHPCVVFVHGAGYLQNVVRAWTHYFREYMFHNYLANKGYIVFEVEYRGSAGHGRDFRRDVYMHLGGKDLADQLDGVEYLKKLGYIDSSRIGMYGGSYGGFLPLMALFTSPNTYACAAVLRAVTSWENYYRHNPWYTGARLGTPESNKAAYERSSPITFADSLTKPLLILHGMRDDNVFFQDAVQLVHALQKAGKKFDVMMYPAESHSFTEPESWFDEYRRIDEFFDRHLRNE